MGNLCSRPHVVEFEAGPYTAAAWQQQQERARMQQQAGAPLAAGALAHNAHLNRVQQPAGPQAFLQQPVVANGPGYLLTAGSSNLQSPGQAHTPSTGHLPMQPAARPAASSSTPTTSNSNSTAQLNAQQQQQQQPAREAEAHSPHLQPTQDPPATVTSPQAQQPASPVISPSVAGQQQPQELRRINWAKGKLIGAGAFGRVFQGLDQDTGHLLAVKQVTLTKDEALKGRLAEHIHALEAEVAVLRQLDHRNIVRYLGTERTDDTLNIFLEFVPGGSIASLVEKFGPLQERLVKLYTYQILQGLEYLHRKKIMHRDIKGANILVDPLGTVKLADFGASRRIEDLATVGSGSKSIRGTPFWMAPEVIRQTGHGRPADIWSLGCVVIEMADGKPPWSNCTTQVAAMFHIASTRDPPLMPKSLSKEGKDFLHLCFNRVPKDRPNATRLLQHEWLRDVQLPSASTSITASTSVGIAPSVAFHQPTGPRHPLVPMLALQHSPSPSSPIKEESETARDTARETARDTSRETSRESARAAAAGSHAAAASCSLPPPAPAAAPRAKAAAPAPSASASTRASKHALPALHMPLAVGPLEQGRRQALLAQSQRMSVAQQTPRTAAAAAAAAAASASVSPPPAAPTTATVTTAAVITPAPAAEPGSSAAATAVAVPAAMAAASEAAVAAAAAAHATNTPAEAAADAAAAAGGSAAPHGLDLEALAAVAANACTAPNPTSPHVELPHPSMLTLNFNPMMEPSWNPASMAAGGLPAALRALSEQQQAGADSAAGLACIQESAEQAGEEQEEGEEEDSTTEVAGLDSETSSGEEPAAAVWGELSPTHATAAEQDIPAAAAVAYAQAMTAAAEDEQEHASDTLAAYDQPDAWCQTLALNASAGWLSQGKGPLGEEAAAGVGIAATGGSAGGAGLPDKHVGPAAVAIVDVGIPAVRGQAAGDQCKPADGRVGGAAVMGVKRSRVGMGSVQHSRALQKQLLADPDPVQQSKNQQWASELDAELAAMRQQRTGGK